VRDGFLREHVPEIRARYRRQRDAMQAALQQHLAPLGCRFDVPSGGMFFWVELPGGIDAMACLPRAVEAGVAYVPGAAFYSGAPRRDTLRLSFVTVSPDRIEAGVDALGGILSEAMEPVA
jgi:2-aminoadipate transaminase